ncbi:hypothetical protein Tco_0525188 [Tanacetum coccineum]
MGNLGGTNHGHYSVNATQAVEDLPKGIDNPTQLIASFDKKELNVYQASWSSRCISLEADVVVVGFYMSLDQS